MEWIKSSERLPEQGQDVLCMNENGEMFVACYFKNECSYPPFYLNHWNSEHCCGREKGDAIYWMPLPKPP